MKTSVKVKISVAVILMVVALAALGTTLGLVFSPASPVLAEDGVTTVVDDTQDAAPADDADGDKGMIAMAAAIAVGIAAAAGAIAMGIAVAKTNESIARQPEAKADIRSSMMLGLVFIETAIIYALIVAILLIFVL